MDFPTHKMFKKVLNSLIIFPYPLFLQKVLKIEDQASGRLAWTFEMASEVLAQVGQKPPVEVPGFDFWLPMFDHSE